jgi:hypothetical protein
MVKKQVILEREIKILFIIIFLLGLGGGCSTVSKKASLPAIKQEPQKRIMDDVLFFRELQQIDLDKDGTKEIIAIYATGVNSSGVKVIKFDKDRGNIIFKRIFNTPNTKFEMKKGIPVIKFEEIGQVAGRRVKGAYCWDGKAFILEGK